MTVATFDVLVTGAHLATMTGGAPYGADSRRRSRHRRRYASRGSARHATCRAMSARHRTVDAHGRWLTPGLIDCHTHLVYAGNRADEFEARQQRRELCRHREARRRHPRDGPRDPRGIGDRSSSAESEPRLAALAAEGVTTVEIKSGYGLDTANELPHARRARRSSPPHSGSTCARRCSPRMRSRRNSRVAPTPTSTSSVARRFPQRPRAGLADAVDAFCETIGFTPRADAARLRGRTGARIAGQAARRSALGLGRCRARGGIRRLVGRPSGIHCRCRRRGDGARRHVGRASARRVLCAARDPPPAGGGAACSRACRSRSRPTAIRARRRRRSLLLMMNMACTLFDLTPEEALAGTTRNAARALGSRRSRHARCRPARRSRAVGYRDACGAFLPDRRQSVRGRRSRRPRREVE